MDRKKEIDNFYTINEMRTFLRSNKSKLSEKEIARLAMEYEIPLTD